jgi:colanic acid/amylovoran biosynthesis glycosyltransferase
VALMEALACRLPVIASDLSGVPELVKHGVTGYLVPPADPAAIARICQHICQHPQEAAAMARAGLQLVERDFNLATNVGQLMAMFEQVMRPEVEQRGHLSVHSAQINTTSVAR